MRRMLSLEDREEITRGVVEELSTRQIGEKIRRDHTVVSREIARHGDPTIRVSGLAGTIH